MKHLSLLSVLLISSSIVYADWTYYPPDIKTPKASCLEMICEYGCVENNKTGEGRCCPEPVEGENCVSDIYENSCLKEKRKTCSLGQYCNPTTKKCQDIPACNSCQKFDANTGQFMFADTTKTIVCGEQCCQDTQRCLNNQKCVECVSDRDCTDGFVCNAQNVCSCPKGLEWSESDKSCIAKVTVSGYKEQLDRPEGNIPGRYTDQCYLYFEFPKEITSGRWKIIDDGGSAGITESTWYGASNCQGSHSFSFKKNNIIDLDSLKVASFPTSDINRDCPGCCGYGNGVHVHSEQKKKNNKITLFIQTNTVVGYHQCTYSLAGKKGAIGKKSSSIKMKVKRVD
jgi:hypothetical protein